MTTLHIPVESWRDPALTSEDLYAKLRGLYGFGAYAAGSMMHLLGHYDQLGIDSIARAAFTALHLEGDPPQDSECHQQMIAFYAPFGQWAGLALWMDVLAWDRGG